MSKWEVTDPSCNQRCNKIDENRFLYQEDRIYHNTNKTYVYESLMDFNDYDENDIENGVSAYYNNLDEIKNIYGDKWKQIVLECIFEQEDSDIELGY